MQGSLIDLGDDIIEQTSDNDDDDKDDLPSQYSFNPYPA